MTDIDIVDELRGFAEWWRENSHNGDTIYSLERLAGERSITASGLDRAAAEIERLRGEVEWEYGVIAGPNDEPEEWYPMIFDAWDEFDELREVYSPKHVKVVRRRRASKWEPIPEGENDDD